MFILACIFQLGAVIANSNIQNIIFRSATVTEYSTNFRLWLSAIFLVRYIDRYIEMNQDLIPFLIGIAILVLYLLFSAATEMGTKLPWKK